MLYEMNFDTDPLFGLKVCLTIDRAIQLFLVSCQEAASFDKINFRYLDFSFDIESIEKGRFICTPPPPLLDLFAATSPSPNLGGGKRKRQNALSTNRNGDRHGEGADELIKNPDKIQKWILNDNEDYKAIFPRAIWTDDPPPFMNGSSKRCCPRWHNRGYCFKNCNRSHGVLNTTSSGEYLVWQHKHREAAKQR